MYAAQVQHNARSLPKSGDPLIDKVMRACLDAVASLDDLPAGMTRLDDQRPAYDPHFERQVQRRLLAIRLPELQPTDRKEKKSYLIRTSPKSLVEEPYSFRRMSKAAVDRVILVSRLARRTLDFHCSVVTVLFGAKLQRHAQRRRDVEAKRRHVALSIALVRMTAPKALGARRGAVDLKPLDASTSTSGQPMQGGLAFATRTRRQLQGDAGAEVQDRLEALKKNLEKGLSVA